jgi:hypothetical protein
MLWFGSMASITAIGSLLAFAYSIATVDHTWGVSIVVPVGAAMLLGALTIFFLFAGAIGELVYKTGNLKLDTLAELRASFTGFQSVRK